MPSKYITPHLISFNSLDEFIDPNARKIIVNLFTGRKQNKDRPIEWKDLIHTKRAFIIGEPGCGKSTFLKEIVIQASGNGKQGIIFPINQISSQVSIENYFEEVALLGDLEATNLFEESAFKTNDFKWEDTENVIVCLDALDEVNANDFNGICKKIKKFSDSYSNISIIISCRSHYITSSQNTLRQFIDYAYVKVQSFTEYQIREF